ncbi:mitochondrial Rho GTPase 1 [Olea europaea subsp. europaea]|uniref:Mitochondrial Rho GTPase 1 n=1 Tax=Olea europaea subsp. europaea TaxID=158383 RepID=A0A8S0VCR5_OLEEU|nr:mitochondrial Rho GTPase 1 [Olea europaea subsp. europaea]
MIGGPIPVGRTSIRIDVVGYRATGKSSLIAAVASETFSREFLLLENRWKLAEELKLADVVVLTYACDQPTTLSRISSLWLYELRRLEDDVLRNTELEDLYSTAPER